MLRFSLIDLHYQTPLSNNEPKGSAAFMVQRSDQNSWKLYKQMHFHQLLYIYIPWNSTNRGKNKKYFTSSDPRRDIILKHIRHKFWHSFCPSVSKFHQNYPLLLVPSPGSGPSSDHCDLSSQTDSNWLSVCLIQNNFRRLGASKLRFERYKTICLS